MSRAIEIIGDALAAASEPPSPLFADFERFKQLRDKINSLIPLRANAERVVANMALSDTAESRAELEDAKQNLLDIAQEIRTTWLESDLLFEQMINKLPKLASARSIDAQQ